MDTLPAAIAILALAMIADQLFGEPRSLLHPTVWMGKVSEAIVKRLWLGRPSLERLQGVILAVFVVVLFAIPTYYGLRLLSQYFGFIPYLVVSIFLLKITMAIKALERFTAPIAEAAREGNYTRARELLRNVVRRDPNELSEQQVLSAAVETIAEGTVDGVTGPLFLYSLIGVPGAVAYRVVNTLDSTIGYKDRVHLYVGWFSARLDTAVNYVPARITGILTVVSAGILSFNWSNCLRILERDHARTESLNAGWSMSAMAGALGVMLEKPGFYALGESSRSLEPDDIVKALKIMKLNVLLFTILVCLPLIVLSRTLVLIA